MGKDTKTKIAQAFQAAIKSCGGKPRMLAALNISESWMHACINNDKVPLELALKLQTATKLKHRWEHLCPEKFEEISNVSTYIID